ncbi:hypothetical protein STAS_29274 [Striga asiatica]|uniref:Uncharacterized protein n=1 Tax=Striga asiatica TaxID=4170 RepID=A0A5A7R386_STRAF|nr:hypothetical protein STAS_29274 [Striga asiatica]
MGTHGRRRHSRRQPPPALLPPQTSTGSTSAAVHAILVPAGQSTAALSPATPTKGPHYRLLTSPLSAAPAPPISKTPVTEPSPTSTIHDHRVFLHQPDIRHP